ncbi:hypothetical protein ON010_g18450 [Phytophthora cinnamomi]|nr:hypothetical protein ON010_g18450 [Phytophthora cinnamomi]
MIPRHQFAKYNRSGRMGLLRHPCRRFILQFATSPALQLSLQATRIPVMTIALGLIAVAITSTIADDAGEESLRGTTKNPGTDAQRKLAFAPGHKGGACEDMLCPDNYAPVCGSDNVTYSNECNLGIASCNHPEKNITQVSDGECATTPSPLVTPSPKTSSSKSTGEQSCDFLCTEEFNPVYDENGVQYSNACFMKLAKCGGTTKNPGTDAQRKLAFAPGHKGGACEDMLCPDNYAPLQPP